MDQSKPGYASAASVAIVDNQRRRREAMKSAFSDPEPAEYWEDSNEKPVPADVILLHYGDQDWKLAKTLCKNANLVVYYGGDGEPDPRWDDRPQHENDQRIRRAISPDGHGSLTPAEALALFAYASAVSSGTSAIALPPFLQRSEVFPESTLAAYLLVVAGMDIHLPEYATILKDAIAESGGENFREELEAYFGHST